MTEQDWIGIKENWWGNLYCTSIRLRIDGYNISLYNKFDKKKMILYVAVYVNGAYKMVYADKDNEVGNRFFQRIKKPLYNSKELKNRQKTFGKQSEFAKQRYCEYNAYYWRSFTAFKRHITANNKSVELI